MSLLLFAKLPYVFAAAPCAPHSFFFLPPWWEYLKLSTDAIGECSPVFTFPNDVWLVGLAVLDMLLRLAGFAAVISIMIAGTQHLFTGGNPDKAASARRRLYNSLIGLAIALIATAVVTFLGNQVAHT
jgi:hypothetical protein